VAIVPKKSKSNKQMQFHFRNKIEKESTNKLLAQNENFGYRKQNLNYHPVSFNLILEEEKNINRKYKNMKSSKKNNSKKKNSKKKDKTLKNTLDENSSINAGLITNRNQKNSININSNCSNKNNLLLNNLVVESHRY